EPAPVTGTVRRAAFRRSRAGDRVAHSDGSDRHRILPGDASTTIVPGVLELLRVGQPSGATAAHGTHRSAERHGRSWCIGTGTARGRGATERRAPHRYRRH